MKYSVKTATVASTFGLLTFLMGCGSPADDGKRAASSGRITSVAEADANFLEAASRKEGHDGKVMAKMLIGLRRDDNWSWEQLQDEVDFQFGSIADEFGQWKENCIAVGDI